MKLTMRGIAFCLCFLFALSASAQKKYKKISGVSFKGKSATQLKKLKTNSFSVDQTGKVQVKPGYEMVKNGNMILIKPKGVPVKGISTRDGSKELVPGVTLTCLGCDACNVTGPSSSGAYTCSGSCGENSSGCNEFVNVDTSKTGGSVEGENGREGEAGKKP